MLQEQSMSLYMQAAGQKWGQLVSKKRCAQLRLDLFLDKITQGAATWCPRHCSASDYSAHILFRICLHMSRNSYFPSLSLFLSHLNLIFLNRCSDCLFWIVSLCLIVILCEYIFMRCFYKWTWPWPVLLLCLLLPTSYCGFLSVALCFSLLFILGPHITEQLSQFKYMWRFSSVDVFSPAAGVKCNMANKRCHQGHGVQVYISFIDSHILKKTSYFCELCCDCIALLLTMTHTHDCANRNAHCLRKACNVPDNWVTSFLLIQLYSQPV